MKEDVFKDARGTLPHKVGCTVCYPGCPKIWKCFFDVHRSRIIQKPGSHCPMCRLILPSADVFNVGRWGRATSRNVGQFTSPIVGVGGVCQTDESGERF